MNYYYESPIGKLIIYISPDKFFISRNLFLIVTSCHRGIGANEKLVGFVAGLEIKKYLLVLKGVDYEC